MGRFTIERADRTNILNLAYAVLVSVYAAPITPLNQSDAVFGVASACLITSLVMSWREIRNPTLEIAPRLFVAILLLAFIRLGWLDLMDWLSNFRPLEGRRRPTGHYPVQVLALLSLALLPFFGLFLVRQPQRPDHFRRQRSALERQQDS